ncbi:MAG: metallophosphoesterase family protein [Clostridia bacterium]
MKKCLSVFLTCVMLFACVNIPILAENDHANELLYITDSGEELIFNCESEDLFGGWGSFDSEESLEHFTTGGYLVEGDKETTLSEASSYWRYNENGYVEALGDLGSKSTGSMLTFVPLNEGDVIGKEKMYYFSMKVYTDTAQTIRIAWNATKTKQFWSIYSATEYGGRYPDYAAAETLLDSDEVIDNNAPVVTSGGWHTIDGYMVAKSDAKYFMLNCRYLKGSESSPTLIDDIVLYEVSPKNAGSELFINDYVIYDSLPQIDGYWTDTKGFVTDGVYTRPEVGDIDTITAHYNSGDTESFTVEVIGEKLSDMDGGQVKVLGKNLIKNASFEYYETDNRDDGETYPFIYSWESTITGSTGSGINNATNGCFEINSDRQVTGKVSMRVRYSDAYNNHSSFNQFVTLSEGTYYFSYYARRTTSDKRNLEIRLNGEVIHSFNNDVIGSDWKKFSYVFDAKEGDRFEFDGYNVSSVYLDAVGLFKAEKLECGVVVNYIDADGNNMFSHVVDNLPQGASYTYDYPVFVKWEDDLYVYAKGEGTISSLSSNKEENVINLVYDRVVEIEDLVIYESTPHHVAPELDKSVTIKVNGKNIKAEAVWEEVEASLYEKEGREFEVLGTISQCVNIKAVVAVTENLNYLEGYFSTADFTTIKKKATSSSKAEITFDLLPLASRIDGVIAFSGDNNTVDAWNSCGIALRLYTDGRVQYYSGSEGYLRSNAFYSRNIVYSVRILADFENKTYSAYLYQKGSYHGTVICENASFRSNGIEMTNIGQCLARGGASSSAGEFIIGNLTWGDCEKVSFIRSFMGEDGVKNVILQANETSSSTAYYVSYEDGIYKGRETIELSYTEGERFTLLLEEKDNMKLMMIDEMLVPSFVAVHFDQDYERSFTTSFMGSFAYYSNDYNSSITDDDPGIVQVTVMEVYSDRIVLNTRNYGEYTGTMENPTPYTIIRSNGDDSNTKEPSMRVLLLGDYQIGKYLLADESYEPVRGVFTKMIEDLKGTKFDAVMIGGDLTYSSSVTEERCKYVVETVLGILKENISPNIYIVAGNHDYNAGERDNYNSANYYEWYMKENNGNLESNGNGYFETSEYYEGDVLIAYCYKQGDIYFMGLSTSPDMMRGNLQYSNYQYTEGAMDWIEEKLKEIGSDKTVFITGHFPLNNSNNIIKSSKGMGTDCTYRLIDIFKDYPNLVYFYGHDHGSSWAFIDSETKERVTVYDMGGYKMN